MLDMLATPPRSSKSSMTLWGALLAIGVAAMIVGNIAMALYGRALREANPGTYIALAEHKLNQGDFPSALAMWQEAYERGPNYPHVHKVLGDIGHRRKEWEEAIRAYDEALRLGSDSIGVRLNILTALLELGRFEKLIQRAKAFMDEGFESPYFSRYIAEAYFRTKKFKPAAHYLERALAFFKNDTYLMDHLMQACRAIGDEERARELQEKIIEQQAILSYGGEDSE